MECSSEETGQETYEQTLQLISHQCSFSSGRFRFCAQPLSTWYEAADEPPRMESGKNTTNGQHVMYFPEHNFGGRRGLERRWWLIDCEGSTGSGIVGQRMEQCCCASTPKPLWLSPIACCAA